MRGYKIMARHKTNRVRVNFMIDKETYEKMQRINKSLNLSVNWSDMMNVALKPVVALIEGAILEINKGDKADLDKIRLMLQGNVVEFVGMAFSELKKVERDVDKIKKRREKKEILKSFKRRKKIRRLNGR